MEVETTDYHTAGEPFRIVTGGAPEIPGGTVRERREFARADEAVDAVRRHHEAAVHVGVPARLVAEQPPHAVDLLGRRRVLAPLPHRRAGDVRTD